MIKNRLATSDRCLEESCYVATIFCIAARVINMVDLLFKLNLTEDVEEAFFNNDFRLIGALN